MSAYAELKARHCQDLFARLPEMIAHIGWSREQLRGERERRLRELIDTAVQRSPWHRARLFRSRPEHGHREHAGRCPDYDQRRPARAL